MKEVPSCDSNFTMNDKKNGEVHPILVAEREKAIFKKEELTYLLYGSHEKYKRKQELIDLFKDDPNIGDLKEVHFFSREQLFSFMVEKSIYFQRRFEELNITTQTDQYVILSEFYPNILQLFTLHFTLFIPTIESMGNEEQIKFWLPKAKNLQIIGAYAQTELGHGTYVRGLETTATYDKETEEFVLNSPTITSGKWWSGGLGINATHCILMAQLYTQGKCYGIHPFIVQIRSLEDHKPLPGVTVGDIGPKMALNVIDNGFLYLDHVHIPRNHLLMKYCQLEKDGTYVEKANTKLFYGSMMYVRAMMILDVCQGLISAITIAIRYSAVRKQTILDPSQGEEQLLNFQTQQYKLFPLLSKAFAFICTGHSTIAAYNKLFSNNNKEDMEQLNSLHALLAGLKAISTWEVTEGIKVCREACGGHGFSLSSGLPQLQCHTNAACTYEGDNTVMLLQTGRYLLKCAQKLSNNTKLYGTVAYLEEDFSGGHSEVGASLHLPALLRLYQHGAQIKLKNVFQQFSSKLSSNKNFGQVWNMISVDIMKTALAHCHIYPVQVFIDYINDVEQPDIKSVLTDLCKLYCVHGIMENLGIFTLPGLLNELQVSTLNNAMFELLKKIRPNAVAIVDAFAISDRKLNSTLGRYDGRVYEALYDYAMSCPLNITQVHDSYDKHLRDFLKERQLKSNL